MRAASTRPTRSPGWPVSPRMPRSPSPTACGGASRSRSRTVSWRGDIVVESLEELASRPVSRIVVRDPESDDDVFNEMVEALGLRGVSYYIGWSAWVDIVPEGVDKAQGLERVCRELGVRGSRCARHGRGYNDMEMNPLGRAWRRVG